MGLGLDWRIELDLSLNGYQVLIYLGYRHWVYIVKISKAKKKSKN